ncbi:MAG: hypothetical protein JJU29_20000 [Verrucomicrobia bacterium]|nr:hypothetical protein [Verrucomicrobiota bacterium]MCH8514255.1 hypothetical protein [Kiritimatiellia bacterium]
MNLMLFQKWLTAGLALCAFGTGGLLTMSWRMTRAPGADHRASAANSDWSWPAIDLPSGDVFARPGEAQFDEEVRHYQLAGTFQTYDFDPESGQGKPRSQLALVDDLRDGRQVMLRTGERLGPFTVSEINLEQLVLSRGGMEWVLTLPGVLAERVASRPTRPATRGEDTVDFEDMPALETTPFGKRVGENMWVIERAAVVGYAEQVMADPRRAIALYDSFTSAPAVDEDGLSGFQLNMVGEREFFSSMGLADGDIIQRVNSMEMLNQNRAEYLVSEFMRANMNAVVLDIERDGQAEKRIFIIR